MRLRHRDSESAAGRGPERSRRTAGSWTGRGVATTRGPARVSARSSESRAARVPSRPLARSMAESESGVPAGRPVIQGPASLALARCWRRRRNSDPDGALRLAAEYDCLPATRDMARTCQLQPRVDSAADSTNPTLTGGCPLAARTTPRSPGYGAPESTQVSSRVTRRPSHRRMWHRFAGAFERLKRECHSARAGGGHQEVSTGPFSEA